jgi:hypothetical protein
MQIKNWLTGDVICEGPTAKEAVELAVKSGISLNHAILDGASLSWTSHDLIAEVLRRAAGDDVAKRMIAGLILVSRDWCWEQFMAVETVENTWANHELARWIKDGDEHPRCLDEYRVDNEAASKVAVTGQPNESRSP